MGALTQDRNIWRRDGQVLRLPVKAGARIYKGAMVCVDDGLAVPATDSRNGLRFAGVAIDAGDNTGKPDGIATVRVYTSGVFPMKREGARDADLGRLAVVVDDQTVCPQPDDLSGLLAGRVVGVIGAEEVEVRIDGYAL